MKMRYTRRLLITLLFMLAGCSGAASQQQASGTPLPTLSGTELVTIAQASNPLYASKGYRSALVKVDGYADGCPTFRPMRVKAQGAWRRVFSVDELTWDGHALIDGVYHQSGRQIAASNGFKPCEPNCQPVQGPLEIPLVEYMERGTHPMTFTRPGTTQEITMQVPHYEAQALSGLILIQAGSFSDAACEQYQPAIVEVQQ